MVNLKIFMINFFFWLLSLCLSVSIGLLLTIFFRVLLYHLFGCTLDINMWHVVINIVLTYGMGFYFLTYVKKYGSKTLYYLTLVKWYIFRYIIIILLVSTGIISAGPVEGFTNLNLENLIGFTIILVDIPIIIFNLFDQYITPFLPSIGDSLVNTNLIDFIKRSLNISSLDLSYLNKNKVTINGEPDSNTPEKYPVKPVLFSQPPARGFWGTVLNDPPQGGQQGGGGQNPTPPSSDAQNHTGGTQAQNPTPYGSGQNPTPFGSQAQNPNTHASHGGGQNPTQSNPPTPGLPTNNVDMASFIKSRIQAQGHLTPMSGYRLGPYFPTDQGVDGYVKRYIANFFNNNPDIIPQGVRSKSGKIWWGKLYCGPSSALIKALNTR